MQRCVYIYVYVLCMCLELSTEYFTHGLYSLTSYLEPVTTGFCVFDVPWQFVFVPQKRCSFDAVLFRDHEPKRNHRETLGSGSMSRCCRYEARKGRYMRTPIYDVLQT